MKIKTDRAWVLKTKRDGDCLDIREHHDGCPDDWHNDIMVPVEAIPDLIKELKSFYEKKRSKK